MNAEVSSPATTGLATARLPVLHLGAALAASMLAALAIAPAGSSARLAALEPEPAGLQGFAAQNPNCNAWSDACYICKRGEDGKAKCSTAGIACTPVEIVCKVEKGK